MGPRIREGRGHCVTASLAELGVGVMGVVGGRLTSRPYEELWWRKGLDVGEEWAPAFARVGSLRDGKFGRVGRGGRVW